MPDFLSAQGPIWGPDFVVVTVTQGDAQYDLEIYPRRETTRLFNPLDFKPNIIGNRRKCMSPCG